MTWLDRYEGGKRREVWTEMIGVVDRDRSDDQVLAAAKAVAAATMNRARTNVERLLELLPPLGYQFEPGAGLSTFVPPPASVVADLDLIEERIGAIPIALRAWFERVGEVNLVGRFPNEDLNDDDPLVVQAPAAYILSEHATWAEDRGTEWDQGPFTIPIAPDRLHKANISGGPPYAVSPGGSADGLVLFEPHQTTFANYLRISFESAGFPGAHLSNGPSPRTELLAPVAAAMLPL